MNRRFIKQITVTRASVRARMLEQAGRVLLHMSIPEFAGSGHFVEYRKRGSLWYVRTFDSRYGRHMLPLSQPDLIGVINNSTLIQPEFRMGTDHMPPYESLHSVMSVSPLGVRYLSFCFPEHVTVTCARHDHYVRMKPRDFLNWLVMRQHIRVDTLR